MKPHRQGTFKLSRDPRFAEEVADIVGLYLDPPAAAVVLSVDEKTQVQEVAQWLTDNPHVSFHFTPTYSSWLNQVVRHESRMSVVELVEGGVG